MVPINHIVFIPLYFQKGSLCFGLFQIVLVWTKFSLRFLLRSSNFLFLRLIIVLLYISLLIDFLPSYIFLSLMSRCHYHYSFITYRNYPSWFILIFISIGIIKQFLVYFYTLNTVVFTFYTPLSFSHLKNIRLFIFKNSRTSSHNINVLQNTFGVPLVFRYRISFISFIFLFFSFIKWCLFSRLVFPSVILSFFLCFIYVLLVFC